MFRQEARPSGRDGGARAALTAAPGRLRTGPPTLTKLRTHRPLGGEWSLRPPGLPAKSFGMADLPMPHGLRLSAVDVDGALVATLNAIIENGAAVGREIGRAHV